MKRKFSVKAFLILLVCALFLCGCSMEPEVEPQPQPPADEISFTTTIPVMLNSTRLTLDCTYCTDYFRGDACVFDKDLALLSLAIACPNERAEIPAAFTAMEFDTQSSFWNDDTEINKCSYCFAHRTVDDYELIAVYVNWVDYDVEWAGNLTVGSKTEGVRADHEGFDLASQWVYDNLKTYVEENFKDRNLKIWITGYSRAAAITDALACKIIEKKELKVKQSDLYAYSFEAPASIDEEYVKEYQCIHNIVSQADIVAALPPAAWGMARPGVAVDITADRDTINGYLSQLFGEGVQMPVFTPDETYYTTPTELVTFIMDTITEKGKEPSEAPAGCRDRETYVTTVQPRLTYLTKLFMKDSKKALGLVKDALMKKQEEEGMWALLALLSGDGFYEFVKPVLDANNIEYVDAELKEGCSLISDIAQNGNILTAAMLFADEAKSNSAKYTAACHYPEVFYVLLKNYQNQ